MNAIVYLDFMVWTVVVCAIFYTHKLIRLPVDIFFDFCSTLYWSYCKCMSNIFSHQIWMFVTLVHVKILELATTLEQGGLCACVLQISEESHVQVRA